MPDTPAAAVPPLTPADAARVGITYHFCRIQFPALAVSEQAFRTHLHRAVATYAAKTPTAVTWAGFLEGLYALDWTVCCGCVERLDRAWEVLFNTRTGRSDCLLVDALRARACRLYPRDDERQESAVNEFWSHLIVPESEGSVPVLMRYDGQRPLAPWLIRVFQNWHLSKLRQHPLATAMPDDDIAMPLPAGKTDTRWHEAFVTAARDWLGELNDWDRLILGLRWRYKMSQREVAKVLGKHEGTISRDTTELGNEAVRAIGDRMKADGWTGDDLEGLILTEMGGLLLDDPRLSADQLAKLLHAKGKELPAA